MNSLHPYLKIICWILAGIWLVWIIMLGLELGNTGFKTVKFNRLAARLIVSIATSIILGIIFVTIIEAIKKEGTYFIQGISFGIILAPLLFFDHTVIQQVAELIKNWGEDQNKNLCEDPIKSLPEEIKREIEKLINKATQNINPPGDKSTPEDKS